MASAGGTDSGATCGICCEDYNKSTRAPRECPFCAHRCCLRCLETYLLSTVHEPHCMAPSCRRAFTLEHQDSLLPASFRKGPLRGIHEEILFVREKALLPETQRRLEEAREAIRSRIQSHEAEINRQILFAQRAQNEMEAVVLGRNSQRFAELAADNRRIDDAIRDLSSAQYGRERVSIEATEPARAKFTWPCPAEGCRGFLSSAWKCGTCSKWACPDCLEVRGDERAAGHTCEPEKKASAALIRKDTRPCPVCHSLIFKISGCDQMYCTVCHTPFSWSTGAVVKGVIHNPHYYEFRRQQGLGMPRADGDVPCGGLPSLRELDASCGRICARLGVSGEAGRGGGRYFWDGRWTRRDSPPFPGGPPFVAFHRMLIHINEINLRGPKGRPWTPGDNTDLRLRYLRQEVDDARFKQLLRHREKRRAKEEAYRDVYRMIHDCGADMMRALCLGSQESDAKEVGERYETACRTLDALVKYFNEAMEKVSRRFDSSLRPSIDPEAHLHTTPNGPVRKRKKAAGAPAAGGSAGTQPADGAPGPSGGRSAATKPAPAPSEASRGSAVSTDSETIDESDSDWEDAPLSRMKRR